MKKFKLLLPLTLDRYILKTFVGPFAAGFSFFTFILILFYLKEIIKSAVEKGIDLGMVLQLVLYSMGWTVGLTVPMATLMAVIMSVSGMNADSEVIAMRASGITYPRILRPYLYFGVVAFAVLVWFSQSVVPYSEKQMRTIMTQIKVYDPIAIIEPGQFTTLDKTGETERQIFIEEYETTSPESDEVLMKNIQIRKTENVNGLFRLSELIVAARGRKIKKKNSQDNYVRAIRLYDGYVFTQDRKNNTFQRIDFSNGSMDINIIEQDLSDIKADPNNISMMNYFRLSENIDRFKTAGSPEDKHRYRELMTEYHKRIALPFSTFAFLLLGFPLGIVNRRSGKGMGLGLSVIFIFIYFVFFLSADTLAAEKQIISPFLAAWAANFISFIAAAYLFLTRTYEIDWVAVREKLGLKEKE